MSNNTELAPYRKKKTNRGKLYHKGRSWYGFVNVLCKSKADKFKIAYIPGVSLITSLQGGQSLSSPGTIHLPGRLKADSELTDPTKGWG